MVTIDYHGRFGKMGGMDEWPIFQRALKDLLESLRRKGETQAEFGERFGIAQQTVSSILSGDANVTARQIARIAEDQGKSITWVLLQIAARLDELRTVQPPLAPLPDRLARIDSGGTRGVVGDASAAAEITAGARRGRALPKHDDEQQEPSPEEDADFPSPDTPKPRH